MNALTFCQSQFSRLVPFQTNEPVRRESFLKNCHEDHFPRKPHGSGLTRHAFRSYVQTDQSLSMLLAKTITFFDACRRPQFSSTRCEVTYKFRAPASWRAIASTEWWE